MGCERYTVRVLTVPHIHWQKYIILKEIFFCSSFTHAQYDSNTSWTVSDIQDMKHLQGWTKKHELSAVCIKNDVQTKL